MNKKLYADITYDLRFCNTHSTGNIKIPLLTIHTNQMNYSMLEKIHTNQVIPPVLFIKDILGDKS